MSAGGVESDQGPTRVAAARIGIAAGFVVANADKVARFDDEMAMVDAATLFRIVDGGINLIGSWIGMSVILVLSAIAACSSEGAVKRDGKVCIDADKRSRRRGWTGEINESYVAGCIEIAGDVAFVNENAVDGNEGAVGSRYGCDSNYPI